MANLAQIRLSSAIVYHMPGASMLIKAGKQSILVAPTSEVRADLHPGDVRDLVSLCIRNSSISPLYSGLNLNPNEDLEIETRCAPGLFETLGAGLYLITPPKARRVYCFPTLLAPNNVEQIIKDITGGNLSSTLDYDEALCVTLATFEKRLVDEAINSDSHEDMDHTDEIEKAGVVGQILAECAITEEFSFGSIPAK